MSWVRVPPGSPQNKRNPVGVYFIFWLVASGWDENPKGSIRQAYERKTKLALVFPSKRRRGVGVADAVPPGSPLIQGPLGLFFVFGLECGVKEALVVFSQSLS